MNIWPFRRAVPRVAVQIADPVSPPNPLAPERELTDAIRAIQFPSPVPVPVVQPATVTEEIPMSFITTIESDAKTFAAWAEKELGKLSTEAPAITKVVDTIVTYVGGVASILAGLEGGTAASAAVSSAVSSVQSGITAISGLVADFGATPTVAAIASSLATNTAALLAAAKVTNPASVTAATAIVTNLTTLATSLTAAVPAVVPAP